MDQSKPIKVNKAFVTARKQSAWVQLSLRPKTPDSWFRHLDKGNGIGLFVLRLKDYVLYEQISHVDTFSTLHRWNKQLGVGVQLVL